MSSFARPQWRIGSATDPGIKRRGRPNEDALRIFQPRLDPRPPLIVLADGMGGHRGGALASRIVVDSFERHYRQARSGLNALELLGQLVQHCLEDLAQAAERDESVGSMGSTVVAAVLGSERVGVVNVGDSRAYLLREGELRQISTDQSRVAELVRAGKISAREADGHPERNALTMSLSPRRGAVTPMQAETAVREGDVILLCSDGLWSTLSPGEIQAVLSDLEPQPAADKLVALANTSQSADNVSVIVARLGRRGPAADDDTAN